MLYLFWKVLACWPPIHGKMSDPAYGGHAIGKRTLNLIIQWLWRSPIGKVNGRTLVRYWNTSVAPRLKAPKGPFQASTIYLRNFACCIEQCLFSVNSIQLSSRVTYTYVLMNLPTNFLPSPHSKQIFWVVPGRWFQLYKELPWVKFNFTKWNFVSSI